MFFIATLLARSSSVNARQLDGSDFNSEIYLHPSCQPPLDIVFIHFIHIKTSFMDKEPRSDVYKLVY